MEEVPIERIFGKVKEVNYFQGQNYEIFEEPRMARNELWFLYRFK